MKRGTVCWVNLEDTHPPEMGKIRPGLVVSNSLQNELLDTVVVVPLSTRPGEIWPLRIKLVLPGRRDSFAVIPGLRQVSKKRLMHVLGVAPSSFLAVVDEAVQLYLSDG